MAYTNSPLVTYKRITNNKTSPRNHAIDTITIHCVVGQWTAKQGCDYFATTDRECSANYVVGKDGSIGLSVEEKDRSWCSSSSSNDNRAITIEVASDTTHPYAVTAQAYNALVKLVADICKRNGIKKLLWKADKSLVGQVSKQNMTVHRWFANKACPGDYLYERHGEIAEKVNALLGQTQQTTTPANPSSPSTTDTGKTIWGFLISKGLNAYAVAGIMGNLQAESALKPSEFAEHLREKVGVHRQHLYPSGRQWYLHKLREGLCRIWLGSVDVLVSQTGVAPIRSDRKKIHRRPRHAVGVPLERASRVHQRQENS